MKLQSLIVMTGVLLESSLLDLRSNWSAWSPPMAVMPPLLLSVTVLMAGSLQLEVLSNVHPVIVADVRARFWTKRPLYPKSLMVTLSRTSVRAVPD